jgi:hypothetical protein
MGKGGGGQPTQTTSNVTNTNVPEYARPYVENMLGATQQQLFKMDGNNITGFQPYKAYGGTYDEQGNQTAYDPSKAIAGFSPLQQQAQQGIGNMQMPGEFGAAAGATQYATQRALGANYAPSNYGSQFNPQGIGYNAQNAQAANLGYAPMVRAQQYSAPTMDTAQTGYNPDLQNYQMGPAQQVSGQNVNAQNINAAQMGPAQQVSGQNVNAQNINAAQMGPAERVRTQSFAQPGSADAYMSPYMQSVVDIQKREAARQSGIQGTQQQAQATQAGAFGGSRDAIMRAERERNLGQQMGDIQAQGSQAAFQQAQQQFNAEQQARLAAQQANQQAGLTVGAQNLNAQQQAAVQNAANQLQASGMSAQQAMQAALANQQAGLTVGSQNLTAQQQANVQNAANQLQASGMNAQQAMQAALANQQAGLTVGGQNLSANLGVQQLGAQTGLQTSLANLSAQQQANVQNQASQLQTQGMNAQQALQAALANQQTRSQYGLQQGQMTQQTNLANQAAQNQAGQFNAGQNLQAASLGAQYGQAANQLNEQSRQYGAGYGLQGLQAGMQGASQLANIGNQRLQAQQGIYGLQNQVGQQQQLNQQQIINQAMQDYANAQQYPLMQLGTMSNMLRGLPMQSQTTQQYQAQANPITQGIGAIGSLGSLAQVKAKGGMVKSMASGGITSIPRYDVGGAVLSQLAQKNDEELAKEAKESPSPRVREMAAAILKQRQAGMNAEPKAAETPQGVGPMGVDYNAAYAGGGIIAFAGGETVPPTPLPPLTEAQKAAMDAGVMKAVGAGNKTGILKASVPQPPPALPPLTEAQGQAMDQGVREAVGAGNKSGVLSAIPKNTPPELLSINAAPYSGPEITKEAAAPVVDPLADIRLAAKNAQTNADKTQEQIYKENQAALKAQGLDTSEARQKYLEAQQTQRAETENAFKNREYLRRAEFFASWGSTPGNTLVAGMTALKKTIPDMIQDSTDKRTALQQADKAIYELGEATRMEKLGQWEKAAAQKLKAAETAAGLQEKLATATASIEGHKISAKGSTEAATIHAMSNERVQSMRDVVDKLKIESDAATRKQAAELAARARRDSITGLTDAKNQALYQGAQNNAALVESRIDNIMKTPAYEQLRMTASMAPSDTNKTYIDNAKKALKAYDDSFAKQRKTADDSLKMAESRVGITRSDAADSTPTIVSQAEFDKKWPTLKSGQTLTGPDGKTYTKK